jgi:hypothetical protein
MEVWVRMHQGKSTAPEAIASLMSIMVMMTCRAMIPKESTTSQ